MSEAQYNWWSSVDFPILFLGMIATTLIFAAIGRVICSRFKRTYIRILLTLAIALASLGVSLIVTVVWFEHVDLPLEDFNHGNDPDFGDKHQTANVAAMLCGLVISLVCNAIIFGIALFAEYDRRPASNQEPLTS